jgi:hypothetical protein
LEEISELAPTTGDGWPAKARKLCGLADASSADAV